MIPLADLDHLLLAERRTELDGALVLLPAPEVVRRTEDKYEAHLFFEAARHPLAVELAARRAPGRAPVPGARQAPARLRLTAHLSGSGSRGARLPPSPHACRRRSCSRSVHGEEFSIDVFCDFEGRCLGAIPRTMIESKGGESIKGTSIKDEELIEFGRLVAETLPIWGPANVQCFRVSEDRHEVTDVNPRFGGGFPLPLAAGGRYPELALALARGERPEPRLRRFPRGRDDDPLLLGPLPVRRCRRYSRTVLRGPARTSRERAGRGLIVRLGVVALAVLAAGCGSRASLQQPAAPAAPPRRPHAALALPRRRHRGGRRHRAAACTGRSFASGGWPTGRTAKGNAGFRLRRRAPLVVAVAARGYEERAVRMPFQRRRRVVVRVYQPALQWPMYGASPARTQAHPAIGLRPPFRVVWSRGLGSLIEFPAVVSDGVAYVGNNHGTVYALSMRNGRTLWRHVVSGGKMASSPAVVGDELVVHGMDGVVRVLDRRTGGLRFAVRVGSPIESSPIVRDRIDYFGAWNGNVYALDLRTRRFRWIYHGGSKITSSAALAGRTLYIGDYGGRLLALAPGSGRLRWSAGVNGRIYGTPAVWGGRVFVPSSDGGSLTAFTTRGQLPLAGPHRELRLLVAGGVGRPGLLRFLQRPALLRLGLERPGRVDGADRRPGLGRAGGRGRRRLRGELRPPDRRRRRADAAACCSASRTASTFRSRAAAAGCSCTATRGSTRSSRPSPSGPPLPWKRLGRHAPRFSSQPSPPPSRSSPSPSRVRPRVRRRLG